MNRLLRAIQSKYIFDLRALAFMRIGIAAVIIIDCCIRLSSLEAHYTDQGVLPLKALFEHSWDDYHFSLHAVNGLWGFQLLLFGTSILAAFFLMIGYRTRLMTVISWVMLCSLHSRNPIILQGGDDLLRMGLFWGMFLPWQKCYSVDGRYQRPENYTYSGLPVFALLMQVCYVYCFSALEKNSAEWTTEGTALYYALSLDQILWPGGKLIYWYPELLKKLTHIVYHLELFGPLLFLIPYRNAFFRTIAILLFTGFQLGIGLTLFVGLFYLINLVMLWGLLPPAVMSRIDRMTAGPRSIIARWLMRIPLFRQPVETRSYVSPAMQHCVLLCFMVYVTMWNIGNAPQSKYMLSPAARKVGRVLRLDQNWGMFAPGVIKDDGWYILIGTMGNGQQIDIYRGGAKVSYRKPPSVLAEIKDDRWRKYGEQMIMTWNSWMRGYYCNYTMRKWNEAHPDQVITRLEVIYMMEFSQPDYRVIVPTRESLCTCGN